MDGIVRHADLKSVEITQNSASSKNDSDLGLAVADWTKEEARVKRNPFQSYMTNYSGYVTTRLLLSIAESEYIPGGLWTLSTWYTRDETARRVILFFCGNQVGQSSASLIAYGLLQLRGVAAHPGWFWLFVISGLITSFGGIVLRFFLPVSSKDPHSTFLPKVQIFTNR
ncbi:hypothetical protein F4678DRAFT_478787 [Xylaria arbuscula]|nr:hypothetical protein F4678DRAFT_478787 [Xylaria arbuscula]